MDNQDYTNDRLILMIGDRSFTTSRKILSTYSDYFRLALNQLDKNEQIMSMPQIIPAEYLELILSSLKSPQNLIGSINFENVYQLLLYSQLLQIPMIVAQCNAFLANPFHQIQQRISSPALYFNRENNLNDLSNCMWRSYWMHLLGNSSNLNNIPMPLGLPISSEYSRKRPVVVLSGNSSTSSTGCDLTTTTRSSINNREESPQRDEEDEIIDLSNDDPTNKSEENQSEKSVSFKIETNRENFKLEIAECDGPIKFQKILNPVIYMSKKLKNELDCKSNTNGNGTNTSSTISGEVFQCLFCNQVFKSHYCYQKHKRRHLNPFAMDLHEITDSNEQKDMILKDINVQFFPCKICGAKFPSYYFVHKHKKIWHSSQENLSESGGENSELSTAAAATTNHSLDDCSQKELVNQ